MLLIGTITVLALWLAFLWLADPDGVREGRRDNASHRLAGPRSDLTGKPSPGSSGRADRKPV
jgi:hypothetical protein